MLRLCHRALCQWSRNTAAQVELIDPARRCSLEDGEGTLRLYLICRPTKNVDAASHKKTNAQVIRLLSIAGAPAVECLELEFDPDLFQPRRESGRRFAERTARQVRIEASQVNAIKYVKRVYLKLGGQAFSDPESLGQG